MRWYRPGMETTADAAGRVVIPKPVRDELGLTAGTRLRLEVSDGEVRASRADGGSWFDERDGRPVLVAPEGTPPLTVEAVRDLVERIRR